VSPEFNKTTQTRLIPALATLHNFRRLNDDIEEEDWDPNSEDGSDTYDPFLLPSVEPFNENHGEIGLTPDDLSAGITEEETTQADARRDEIAGWMWRSYQAYLTHIYRDIPSCHDLTQYICLTHVNAGGVISASAAGTVASSFSIHIRRKVWSDSHAVYWSHSARSLQNRLDSATFCSGSNQSSFTKSPSTFRRETGESGFMAFANTCGNDAIVASIPWIACAAALVRRLPDPLVDVCDRLAPIVELELVDTDVWEGRRKVDCLDC
jgi:hypothetical protein